MGYGDYSPRTVIGRVFIFFAILGGVIFFNYIATEFMTIREIQASGRGEFRPSRNRNGHVLLIGGGVACGSAVVLRGFLVALIGPGRIKTELPDVVIMARVPCSEEITKLLAEPWIRKLKTKVQYFVGSILPLHVKN